MSIIETFLARQMLLKERIEEARKYWSIEPTFTDDVDLDEKITFLRIAIEKKQLQYKKE